ncbi:MAG: phage tail protein [Mesorhizobium sp.]|uniref:COG4223 family protein n=1 Tax=Mesorhizobium sp. TaxID=1871066 RepID=UPI0011F544ED|nr:phage tail protein [Mesorhizobium sp.]TIP75138.1 MAG: phage tail protein [Mesorhizobium sp.]TIQ04900.1 MAG: phage tail protein [Mesorhizobium sp.]TIR52635.1 MAG: phage tail protein [Mesorhizobium sp.]TJV98436.1 MAG: phage tail protein [Mesorhizobium sp.]
MVKTPKMRHSKSRREPVTIELEPGAVSRVAEEDAANGRTDEAKAEEAANASQPETPEEPVHAVQTDIEPWEHAEAAPPAGSEEPAEGGAKSPEEPRPTYPAGSEASANRAFDYSFDDASTKASETGASGTGASGTEDAPKETQTGNEGMAAQPKRGGINGIAAGIIGGVVALAAAGGLQFAGLLGAPGAGDVRSGGVSLDSVNGEIASLKSEIAGLKDTAGNNDASAKVDELSSALDQVKADVAALRSAVEQGGAGDTAGLAALGDKVKQIETAVAALGQSGNTAPVDLGPINEKLAGLDALVKSASETAKAQDGRLAALEQSVSQLSGKVEAQAGQPKVALAIAASALKAALDRGAPFAAELETFAAISPDAPEIATLRPYAEKGVSTRAEIAAEVAAAANAMVAASEPVDQNAGFLQNLLSSAESLVKVRPIGAVQGARAPETVARMEVAVNQGDYAKALSEYDTLPEAVKAAGADFAGKLKARIEVEKQVDALIASAMKA